MDITSEIKESLKEDRVSLYNEISSLKKSMTDYKKERKSEWKIFKNKFKDDMDKVEKSFKRLTMHHKK